MESDKKYIIKLNDRTIVTVKEHQLYKKRWIEHFGSVKGVTAFINNYKKK